MQGAARWSLIVGLVAAMWSGTGSPAAAQACGLTIGGTVDASATLDAASGELIIEAPVAFGDALTAQTPIVLDAAASASGTFDVNGDVDLSAGSTQLTWTITTGELTINEADQGGPFEFTAELVAASNAADATGTLQLTATASVVDLVQQPTPLQVTGTVSGNIVCGASSTPSQTPTTVRSAQTSPTTAAGTAAPAADPSVTVEDEDLATTGIGPTLLVVGLLIVITGISGVLYGLGRVRFHR